MTFIPPSISRALVKPRKTKLDGLHYINPVSSIPTMKFQNSMPRLPIPKLDDTLNKYAETIEPLVNKEEFQKTKQLIEQFRQGQGKVLHDLLIQHDKENKHTSYISAPWYEMYLSDRVPLPINYNPQITLTDSQKGQAERVSLLISAALKFENSLNESVLEPDVFFTKPRTTDYDLACKLAPKKVAYYAAYSFSAYPLDMSQYKSLFYTTRVPTKGKDVLQTKTSKHILVLRKGHFYKVKVRDHDSALTDSEILQSIKFILSDPSANLPSEGVGFLTTEQRDKWATTYQELYATNTSTMNDINNAMLVLALNDEPATTLEEISKGFLLGNGANRWYDKSVSILSNPDGRVAINFEHSWGDGGAVLRFVNEIYADSEKASVPKADPSPKFVEKLKWDLSDKIKKSIFDAKQRYEADCNAMDLKILTTEVVNKQQIKDFKVSPDGFLQMSFQLAHYKLNKTTVTTYESASTSGFKHGRTEAIRSATNQSLLFTNVFSNPKSTLEEKNKALRTAIEKHAKITVEALMGKGVDRHLFGLRYMAQKKKMDLPEIFQDVAYKKLNNNILSTSTLDSPSINLGGFGPVAKEGYGIGYGMDQKMLRFNVTSYLKVSPFLEKLHEALQEMTHVLKSSPVLSTEEKKK